MSEFYNRIDPATKQRIQQQEVAAYRLLKQTGSEADVRNSICRLLDILGFDEYHLEYWTATGPIDVYLPRQRTIIEVKAYGQANPHHIQDSESQFEQLNRYMHTEISKERSSLFRDEYTRSWTGILTDGRTWYRWTYEHRDNPTAQEEEINWLPSSAPELAQWLTIVLGGDAVGKPWIPQNPVALFSDQASRLRNIHDNLSGRKRDDTDTKIRLWRDMLRSSGMEPETTAKQQQLFCTHSFLIALARGVVWTMENPRQIPDPESLLGDGIVSWIVQTTLGRQWASYLFQHICSYEWRMRRGDVLRPLYEEFVDKDDRRDFGEVYTPDWLAKMLVCEVLDDDWIHHAVEAALTEIYNQIPIRGIGVLDPCCGSGTFLYSAVQRLLTHPTIQNKEIGVQADIVSRLVCGMDIHPVACEFSRATLLRALPCQPPSGTSALRVYNGDALLLHGTDENSLFRPRNGEVVFISPGDREMRFPRAFVTHSAFATFVGEMTETAQFGLDLPVHVERSVEKDEDRIQILECHDTLKSIIKHEGNSVWTWYITQTVGPYLLAKHKVNRIVSNPPWVQMSTVQNAGRKSRLVISASDLELWQGGKQAANLDIAQLFVKRCRQQYLAHPKSDSAAWVVKHSAIKGSNWNLFRSWRTQHLKREQILDLSVVKVFGSGDARKCCVLVDNLFVKYGPEGPILEASCPKGKPNASSSFREAVDLIEWNQPNLPIPEGRSKYEGDFHRGGDFFPHVLLRVDTVSGKGKTKTVTTLRSKRAPWNGIDPQTVDIPSSWLASLLISDNLLPFTISPDASVQAILPLNEQAQLLDSDSAKANSGWNRLDNIYCEHRGKGAGTPSTLLKRLNHLGNVQRQLLLLEGNCDERLNRVVYPASGDIMRACRVGSCIQMIDTKLYFEVFDSVVEAAFLVALLNAPALNPAFVQSRRSGRDFHLNPWRYVPIPRYDSSIGLHRKLADLCIEAEQMTLVWLHTEIERLPFGQIGRSKRIREMLRKEGLFERLDATVAKLLPNQVV